LSGKAFARRSVPKVTRDNALIIRKQWLAANYYARNTAIFVICLNISKAIVFYRNTWHNKILPL
jgi:hypothetical protein